MSKIVRCALQLFFNLSIFSVIMIAYIKLFIYNDFKNLLLKIPKNKKPLKITEKKFIIISFFIFIFLFLFQAYLCYPGYADWDTGAHIWGDFAGWRSISIPLTGFIITYLLGPNIGYLFLINIFVFYFSLFLFSIFLYNNNKSYFSLLVYLSGIIGTVFFNNMFVHDSSIVCSFILLCYVLAMLFYDNVENMNRKQIAIFTIIYTLIYCYSLLIRHNAIFYIFPAYIIIIFAFIKIIKKNDREKFVKKELLVMALFSLLYVVSLTKANTIFITYPANHVFLHQIMGTSINSGDFKYIDNEWYEKDKNLQDAIETYNDNKLYADSMCCGWIVDRPFKANQKLNNLSRNWLLNIINHPISYYKYLYNFFKANFFLEATFAYDFSINGLEHPIIPYTKWADKIFLNSNFKKTVYNFMYSIMIKYKTYVEIIFMFFVFIFSFMNIENKNFKFMFVISIAYFSCFFIISAFSPMGGSIRYVLCFKPFFIMNLLLFVNEIFLYIIKVKFK